jgi:hypothetical protein
MNGSIQRRLEALEAVAAPPWRVILCADGESEEQVKQRLGVKPGEKVIVITSYDLDL